jgi:hypothetical protein
MRYSRRACLGFVIILSVLINVSMSFDANAADICEAVALRDVAPIGDTKYGLKQGERDTAITQFNVDKKTGESSFCSHGGSCFPTHVDEGGRKVQVLRLTNCEVGALSYQDAEQFSYSVDVIRSKVSPTRLRIEDVDNRLLELGLCSACASNVANLYIMKPASRCGKLAKLALEGNPTALKELQDLPSFCQAW